MMELPGFFFPPSPSPNRNHPHLEKWGSSDSVVLGMSGLAASLVAIILAMVRTETITRHY